MLECVGTHGDAGGEGGEGAEEDERNENRENGERGLTKWVGGDGQVGLDLGHFHHGADRLRAARSGTLSTVLTAVPLNCTHTRAMTLRICGRTLSCP